MGKSCGNFTEIIKASLISNQWEEKVFLKINFEFVWSG